MKRLKDIRGTCSSSKRRWAASLLLVAVMFLACCCAKRQEQEAPVASTAEIGRVSESWIGRYAKKDPAVKKMLTEQEGWSRFRDMDLYEAIRHFSMSPDENSDLGSARAFYEMTRFFEAVDRYNTQIEYEYLSSLGNEATPGQKARRGFNLLKLGETRKARDIFFGDVPKNYASIWTIGRAGVLSAEGKVSEAEGVLRATSARIEPKNLPLLKAASFLWGHPVGASGNDRYSEAIKTLGTGDVFGSLVSLQMVDNTGKNTEADPDIYLHEMFKIVFARMAVESSSKIENCEAALIEGDSKLVLGDVPGALAAYEKGLSLADKGQVSKGDSAWIFGPVLDFADLKELLAVKKGYALLRAGKTGEADAAWKAALGNGLGPLAMANLAKLQVEAKQSGPLGDPSQAALLAVKSVKELRQKVLASEGGDTMASLLLVREAEVSACSAAVESRLGKANDALDRLDSAHQKKQGYKPSFINTPAFMVQLSSAYKDSGQYAPAVEVLFSLINQFPSTRLVYEGLKRQYASKTGGEAPPR